MTCQPMSDLGARSESMSHNEYIHSFKDSKYFQGRYILTLIFITLILLCIIIARVKKLQLLHSSVQHSIKHIKFKSISRLEALLCHKFILLKQRHCSNFPLYSNYPLTSSPASINHRNIQQNSKRAFAKTDCSDIAQLCNLSMS